MAQTRASLYVVQSKHYWWPQLYGEIPGLQYVRDVGHSEEVLVLQIKSPMHISLEKTQTLTVLISTTDTSFLM